MQVYDSMHLSIYYHSLTGSHAIKNLSAIATHPGEIRLTFDLIPGSTAFSVLAIVYPLSSNDSSARYELINREKEETVFSGLAEGRYVVSLFVVVENLKPLQHVAVRSLTVNVMEGSKNSKHILKSCSQHDTHTCAQCKTQMQR